MATLKINGAIVPVNDLDGNPQTFATHYAKYGRGGLVQVATEDEMRSFPVYRIDDGMIFLVVTTSKFYKVVNYRVETETIEDVEEEVVKYEFEEIFNSDSIKIELEEGSETKELTLKEFYNKYVQLKEQVNGGWIEVN